MKESILVINKTLNRTLENLLIKSNFIVYTAENESLASNFVSSKIISTILYNIQTNELNEACEFIEQIKRLFPSMKIIVFSQTGALNFALKLIKAGAYDYFREPIDKDEITSVIKKAISEKREMDLKHLMDLKNRDYLKTVLKELDVTKSELDFLKRDVMAKNLELEIKHGLKNFIALRKNEKTNEIRLGKYVILGEAGRGGMSQVYKAIDTILKRVVAIKELTIIYRALPQEIIGDVIKRFKKEAEVIAKLKHENITRIYDIIEEGGKHYMVMEYVDGVTLDNFVESTSKIPILEIINMICDICEALEYIHQNKIIHRDIKPSNIMITYDRKIKLMDFGVIRDKSISTLTPTGSIVGTVCYTAPEQSMKHVDYRSDIFSIGTVFYEMVVGFNPFECKTYAETFLKITSLKPEVPSKYNYECTDDLDGIILKAMEKNPDKRFSSARELNDALKAFVKKYIDAI